MWRKLIRGIAAPAVALAMLLTGPAHPARANADGISSPIVDAALIGWAIYRSGSATPEQIVEFVRIVTGALGDLENEVKDHIDGLEAKEVLSHASLVRKEMLNYHNMRDNEITVEVFAMAVARYAENAYHKYGAVGRKAKDQIGLGAQVLYPVNLAVRTDIDWTGGLDEFDADYRRLNQRIVADLEPTCTRVSDPEPIPGRIYVRHECTAANGETAVAIDHKVGDTWHSGPVNLDNLKLEAAKNSSWAAARHILAGQGQ
ncbi:hypothetical protein [Plantactinospora endophytica]|uniref:Uncharacterized protein n=1 Tax=Plantactinospora endophytica TaxID=673535 RepID=A0ABQ4E5F3_9ACTN|nr:hypothetical protein [Plantactinospora endophytica]GIG89937.1 hypothetical protein Pen02_48730 [Plantactinospora endophytica]